ncbi:uncharacterized protein LOC120635706 [Pararge aegeria]|uniref:uncharacterized protein LOC120635706 n=1 Tax=Pararge aegeria TaxID=116150 RepID=UPI0019D1D467|nr:uncharacterized protein LOC120635706 [Pararge aegeria]
MSLPLLRQPKTQVTLQQRTRQSQYEQQFIILTLKSSIKLVVTSDSFHCIVNVGDVFKCVLCNTNMDAEVELKEYHKTLAEHHRLLKIYPYLEELGENLVRQIDSTNCFCTICSIVTSVHYVSRHVQNDEHMRELNKAVLRAETYKPCEEPPNVNTVDLNNKK